MEGRGDGKIMAHMDDAAGEGNPLGVVLGGAGEHFGCEVLELDGFGDSTGFVEAIHVGTGVEGDGVKGEETRKQGIL